MVVPSTASAAAQPFFTPNLHRKTRFFWGNERFKEIEKRKQIAALKLAAYNKAKDELILPSDANNKPQVYNRDKTIAFMMNLKITQGKDAVYNLFSGMFYTEGTYESNGNIFLSGTTENAMNEAAVHNDRNQKLAYYNGIAAPDKALLDQFRAYQASGQLNSGDYLAFKGANASMIQEWEKREERRHTMNWTIGVMTPVIGLGIGMLFTAGILAGIASALASSFWLSWMAPPVYAAAFHSKWVGMGLIVPATAAIVAAVAAYNDQDNTWQGKLSGMNFQRDQISNKLDTIKRTEEEYLAAQAAVDYFTKAPSQRVLKDRLVQWGGQNGKYTLSDSDLRYVRDTKQNYIDSTGATYTAGAHCPPTGNCANDGAHASNITSLTETPEFATAAGDLYDPSQLVYGIEGSLQGGFYWSGGDRYVKIKTMGHSGQMTDAYAKYITAPILPGNSWDTYDLGRVMNLTSNHTDALRSNLKQNYLTAGSAHEQTLMLNEREKTMWSIWDYADAQGKQFKGFQVMAGDYQENSTNVFQTQQQQNALLVTQQWDLRRAELDAARARWENLANTIESRGTESFNASEQKFLKAWRQWEIDTNRKIDAGKKQWNDKIRTFMAEKQNWQQEIKAAAMEQSLDKMLAATGSSLNERLRVLAANANIQTDIPEINVTDLVGRAMQDFESTRPSSQKIFGEINKSIQAFNVTLELGNATHFKGFNNSTLEGDFASNMTEFSKRMAILNNVKLYENFKTLIKNFTESLKENDKKVFTALELAGRSAGYDLQGGWFNKDAGMYGDYSFMAYRYANIDGMMNRAMTESGMTQLSSTDMVKFLESGRDVDVKLFFEVQTMALENAFKMVGGGGGKKGLYGDYVGDIAQWKGYGGDLISEGSGELGGWENGGKNGSLTYRGLHEEETKLQSRQGTFQTAMQVTGAVGGALSGQMVAGVIMAAATTTANTGAAFASGQNGWAQLGLGAIQGLSAMAGGFMGGLDYGLGKIGNAMAGVAAQQTVSYATSGFHLDPSGNLAFKPPSKGAGFSALVQGAAGMLGAGLNAKYNPGGGTAAATVSTTFNALADGVQFNDDGSLMKEYNWAKAGTSFAANMASTVVSGYAGNISKSDVVGTQMGRLANTITASLLGDKNAWNAYQPQGIFNTAGTYIGGELAKAFNQRNTAPDKVPVDQQPFRELLGGGAIIAARRREDGKDQDVLGGILQGFRSIGEATLDGADAITGDRVSAMGRYIGNAIGYVGGKLLDGADYMLDKLLSMPETLANLPSAIANKLTGGLVGTSLKLENKFEGVASSPITLQTSGGSLTIPAAEGNHILRRLLSSAGAADDVEYSIFEHRNGKVQINNTSSRKAFTKNEMDAINKLDEFTDKNGNTFKRIEAQTARGIQGGYPQGEYMSVSVFENGNEKIMITQDGKMIQSTNDGNHNVLGNKLFDARGRQIELSLTGDDASINAKSIAMVNYDAATKITSVDGVKFNLFGSAANGNRFANWALNPGIYSGPDRQSDGSDIAAKGTNGDAWLATTRAAKATGVSQIDVYALNYGFYQGDSHATGLGMDITKLHYSTVNAAGQVVPAAAPIDRWNGNPTAGHLDKIRQFNYAFATAAISAGYKFNIWTPDQMHTEGGAGRPNLFSGLQAPIKTTGNQVPYQDLKDDLRRRGVGFSLDDGHLHHGHYYLVR